MQVCTSYCEGSRDLVLLQISVSAEVPLEDTLGLDQHLGQIVTLTCSQELCEQLWKL